MTTALEQMTATFAEAGLTAPPIPAGLVDSLRVLSRWCFGTRDVSPIGMYLFDEYFEEAFDLATQNYVAVSHAGHGAHSYAITYQVVFRNGCSVRAGRLRRCLRRQRVRHRSHQQAVRALCGPVAVRRGGGMLDSRPIWSPTCGGETDAPDVGVRVAVAHTGRRGAVGMAAVEPTRLGALD